MRRIIIINDNSKDVLLLQDYLKTSPDVLIAGVFSSLSKAQPTLEELKCDIIFSTLPILSVLTTEKKELPVLVCMGNESETYSLLTSRNIFAFLHTPFSCERVLSLIQNIELYMLQLSSRSTEKRDYVFIKSEYKLIKINLSDILYLSGLRDYTQVFLKGKLSPLTTLQNLKDFEARLPENSFIRVHRSYIVSLSQVDSISRNEISIGTHTIPIGNAYRQLLDEMITKNS
ncbi:MAG: LytTR family DNA-binding domain-containing protein [Bacteroidota bacterium]